MNKELKNKANDVTDLTITKVDFVDAGANQRANIALFKHQPPKGGEDNMEKEKENPVKKAFITLAKALGITTTEDDAPPASEETQEVAKSNDEAQTFDEKMKEADLREVIEQVWDVTDALRCSLISILRDDEVTDKTTMLKQSIDQFSAAAKGFADAWTGGNLAAIKKLDSRPMNGIELEVMKSRAEDVLKACASPEKKTKKEEPVPDEMNPDGTPKTTPKKKDAPPKKAAAQKSEEEDEDMKINKSKLTPAELAFYEEIVKKAGYEDEAKESEQEVAKAQPEQKEAEQPKAAGIDDVLKALPKELSDIVTNLQKRVEEMDDREMLAIAKKYEILGKKPEELAPVLKRMKKTSPEGYEETIKALDQAVQLTEQSGIFGEVGKRGVSASNGSAWAQIEKKAEEIRKAAPGMEYHESIDKACAENPDLVHEYENGE